MYFKFPFAFILLLARRFLLNMVTPIFLSAQEENTKNGNRRTDYCDDFHIPCENSDPLPPDPTPPPTPDPTPRPPDPTPDPTPRPPDPTPDPTPRPPDPTPRPTPTPADPPFEPPVDPSTPPPTSPPFNPLLLLSERSSPSSDDVGGGAYSVRYYEQLGLSWIYDAFICCYEGSCVMSGKTKQFCGYDEIDADICLCKNGKWECYIDPAVCEKKDEEPECPVVATVPPADDHGKSEVSVEDKPISLVPLKGDRASNPCEGACAWFDDSNVVNEEFSGSVNTKCYISDEKIEGKKGVDYCTCNFDMRTCMDSCTRDSECKGWGYSMMNENHVCELWKTKPVNGEVNSVFGSNSKEDRHYCFWK